MDEQIMVSQEDDWEKNLHWICGNTPSLDPKMKFNAVDFCKVIGEEKSFRSCLDENSSRLTFETKGPYVHYVNMPSSVQQPKCFAIDVFFKQPVTVAKIRFQNFYVAYVSVLAKMISHRHWRTLQQHTQLMPTPHYETGSRAYFEFVPTNDSWEKVTELRFLLLQPSSCWKKISIEHLTIYGENEPLSSQRPRCGNYLFGLMRQTEEALKMVSRNRARESVAGSSMPLHIGTTGYEIEKLPPLV